jgi:hypothetical protein
MPSVMGDFNFKTNPDLEDNDSMLNLSSDVPQGFETP